MCIVLRMCCSDGLGNCTTRQIELRVSGVEPAPAPVGPDGRAEFDLPSSLIGSGPWNVSSNGTGGTVATNGSVAIVDGVLVYVPDDPSTCPCTDTITLESW